MPLVAYGYRCFDSKWTKMEAKQPEDADLRCPNSHSSEHDAGCLFPDVRTLSHRYLAAICTVISAGIYVAKGTFSGSAVEKPCGIAAYSQMNTGAP